MTYWLDFIFVMLPGLLFSSVSLLPLGWGIFKANIHLQKGERTSYIRTLSGSMVSGLLTVAMLFGSLYGDDLSTSSTAAIIFVVAPVYAAIAYTVGYGLGVLITDKAETSIPISLFNRLLLLIPISILSVLIAGMLNYAIQNNDSNIAYHATHPDTLIQVYNKSLLQGNNSFSIALGLTQNSHTPPQILRELATHEQQAIRIHVAQHASTPIDVLKYLRDDNSSCVSKTAKKRFSHSSMKLDEKKFIKMK